MEHLFLLPSILTRAVPIVVFPPLSSFPNDFSNFPSFQTNFRFSSDGLGKSGLHCMQTVNAEDKNYSSKRFSVLQRLNREDLLLKMWLLRNRKNRITCLTEDCRINAQTHILRHGKKITHSFFRIYTFHVCFNVYF